MDTSDEELVLLAVAALISKRKVRKKRSVRVTPYLEGRKEKSRFATDVSCDTDF
jgi:hypothetical protein